MNFKTIITSLGLASLLLLPACREDFDFEQMSTSLRFSADTISVDTVYNFSKSETYVLKLYNPDDKDFVIPTIKLAKGNDSYFKINVDGKAGSEFTNIPIRKKDSLFIFVEIDAKTAPENPFYEDEIIFNTTQNQQQVKLVSWIEKAQIHTPNTSISTATWNENEAHVIDGNLSITNQLTINQGTKVYFKTNGSLTIDSNASLIVNGNLGNEVKFRTARHDAKYDSIPNQWKKIELKPNSRSTINYAKIIGAEIGLHVNQATLNLSNSYIVNHQSYGILANNSKIKAHNILVNNTNLAALAIENGGEYEFYQSTFANYFNLIGSAGPAYALYLSNYSNDQVSPLTKAIFGNCIFYNQRTPNAIVFDKKENAAFDYRFDTNLFKNSNTAELNMLTAPGFTHSIIGNPLFKNPEYTANKLSVKENSPALNAGNTSIAQQYPTDYYGNNRSLNPTLGAIQ